MFIYNNKIYVKPYYKIILVNDKKKAFYVGIGLLIMYLQNFFYINHEIYNNTFNNIIVFK